jgi:hypothetical protein
MAGKYEAARSLAETQLQVQFAILGGLDTQALGILGVDVALAAVTVAAQSILERLWWLPLTGLTASGLACFVALVGSSDRMGPTITTVLDKGRANEAVDAINLDVAEQLRKAIDLNELHISRGSTTVGVAVLLLLVALVLAVVSGVIVS